MPVLAAVSQATCGRRGGDLARAPRARTRRESASAPSTTGPARGTRRGWRPRPGRRSCLRAERRRESATSWATSSVAQLDRVEATRSSARRRPERHRPHGRRPSWRIPPDTLKRTPSPLCVREARAAAAGEMPACRRPRGARHAGDPAPCSRAPLERARKLREHALPLLPPPNECARSLELPPERESS